MLPSRAEHLIEELEVLEREPHIHLERFARNLERNGWSFGLADCANDGSEGKHHNNGPNVPAFWGRMPERAKQTRSIIRSNIRLGRPLFGHHNVNQQRPITYEAARTRLPAASHIAGSSGTTDAYGTREARDVASGVPYRRVALNDRRLWDTRGQIVPARGSERCRRRPISLGRPERPGVMGRARPARPHAGPGRYKRLRGDSFDHAYRAMAAAELEALASATASPEAAVALKLHKPETATADANPKEPWQVAAESGAWKYTVQVLPGLEIVIAKDASPLARRLARQFIADGGVGKPDAR